MTLGIFLAMGDSFGEMAKSGRDIQFKKFYLSFFAKKFTKIYVFSYTNEVVDDLPSNIDLIPNRYSLHRYLYGLLMPFLNISYVLKCDVLRVYHLTGTIPAILAKIFFAKPFIFNYAYDYEKFAKIENKLLQTFFLKILEPIAALFVSKTFAANEDILKKLSKNKAVYLPNGVDVIFFKPIKKKQTDKIPVILSVGRLEKQKNFENLVGAVKGIGAKLVIVGKGSQKKKLENLAKRNQVYLKIIDKVPHTQIPKIYNNADIFVLPSLAEGSPKALLEAMSCGLQVIGTKSEGIKELIIDKRNGLICNASSQSIRNKIMYLVKNKRVGEKLGENAREFVEKNHNLKKLIKEEILAIKSIYQ